VPILGRLALPYMHHAVLILNKTWTQAPKNFSLDATFMVKMRLIYRKIFWEGDAIEKIVALLLAISMVFASYLQFGITSL
jgi:hypothetical protein